jgi:hypothetical protein
MNYTPETEEQLAEEDLLPEGIYDFQIIDSDDRPSKKGNDMFTLKLCVYDVDGNERHIFDYIAMGNSFGERKLRHAAVACGLLDVYSSGNLSRFDFLNASGKVKLKQQKGTDDFPLPKNVVLDYIRRDEGPTDTRPSREIIDDGIPF